MDNNVERLHRALVNAMRNTQSASLERPVTVSEIYQKLLPYRTARVTVGFEMNADYEYALLRLLAGEGNLARLEPAEVRESLRLELDSPNPNVSLFREYANCDVWVTNTNGESAEIEEAAEDNEDEYDVPRNGTRFLPELVEDLDEDDDVELAFEPEEDEDEDVNEDEAEQGFERVTPAIPLGTSAHAPECAFCGGDLPPGRLVNFCPHCGNDLTRRPCSSCGEILEPMWRFCISCGSSATGFDENAN